MKTLLTLLLFFLFINCNGQDKNLKQYRETGSLIDYCKYIEKYGNIDSIHSINSIKIQYSMTDENKKAIQQLAMKLGLVIEMEVNGITTYWKYNKEGKLIKL